MQWWKRDSQTIRSTFPTVCSLPARISWGLNLPWMSEHMISFIFSSHLISSHLISTLHLFLFFNMVILTHGLSWKESWTAYLSMSIWHASLVWDSRLIIVSTMIDVWSLFQHDMIALAISWSEPTLIAIIWLCYMATFAFTIFITFLVLFCYFAPAWSNLFYLHDVS